MVRCFIEGGHDVLFRFAVVTTVSLYEQKRRVSVGSKRLFISQT